MSAFGMKPKYASIPEMTWASILDSVRTHWTAVFHGYRMGKGYDPKLLDEVIGKSIPELEKFLAAKGTSFQLGGEPMKVAIPDPRSDNADLVNFDDYRCLIVNKEANKSVLMRYDLYMRDSVFVFGQESFGWKNPYQF